MKKIIVVLLMLCLLCAAALAEGSGMNWTSSNPSVVSVDAEGNLTALGIGEATITCTDADGNIVSFVITVESYACPGCETEITDTEMARMHGRPASCKLEGHYNCDGLNHESKADPYCDADPVHLACKGNLRHTCPDCEREYNCYDSGSHAKCRACGDRWCNGKSHYTPPCGNILHRPCRHTEFDGADHQKCGFCGKFLCDGGAHGKEEGQCGFVEPTPTPTPTPTPVPTPTHTPEPKKCSFCNTEGEEHAGANCGSHCVNQSGDHTKCWVCGNYYCASGWQHHNSCDHCYKSSSAGSHAWCTLCDSNFLCYGEHGPGLCI